MMEKVRSMAIRLLLAVDFLGLWRGVIACARRSHKGRLPGYARLERKKARRPPLLGRKPAAKSLSCWTIDAKGH